MNFTSAGQKNRLTAEGQITVDPSKNVLDLVEAAVKRLDDLRDLEAVHRTEIMLSDRSHREELARVRETSEEKLRLAEAARIDAIRAVDVAATATAAAVSEQRASTLAAQVAAQAETLRTQVATVAAAASATLATALEPIQKAIEELSRNQYKQQGEKSAIVDTRTQANWSIGTIIGVVFGSIGILSFILALSSHVTFSR